MRHRSRQWGSWAPLVQLTNLCILAAVVVQPSNANLTSWNKVEMMKGTSFWNHFSFFTAPDPTHGYINYVSEDTARNDGIINVSSTGQVFMSVDTRSQPSGPRASVRLTSKNSYTGGLFILDVEHIPTGCGTWPAWWLVGPGWPSHGEIDVVEGVHISAADTMTLHTSQGCTQDDVDDSKFSGKRSTGKDGRPATDCYVNAPSEYGNQGCGIVGSNGSYGAPFNANGGGVYALVWDASEAGGIEVYFWPRGSVPTDVTAGRPTGSGWGLPAAYFGFAAQCPATHFSDMSIVFDLVICGDWAGATFESVCPGRGTCQQFSDAHPEELSEAFWLVNSLSVYNRSTVKSNRESIVNDN